MEHAAIPTKYKGIQFRSRLEARWAAYLDLKGDSVWEYEPVDFSGWIPDFTIKIEKAPRPALVEIKPIRDIDAFVFSPDGHKILAAVLKQLPIVKRDYFGIMLFGLGPDYMWFLDRTCWQHLTGSSKNDAESRTLQHYWRLAGNTVQWKAPQ